MKNVFFFCAFSLLALPAFSQDQVCETLASRAVKANYPELFQRDFEGRMRYIAYSVCRPHNQLKYCRVGTRTVDTNDFMKFSVILSGDCTRVVETRLEMTRDE